MTSDAFRLAAWGTARSSLNRLLQSPVHWLHRPNKSTHFQLDWDPHVIKIYPSSTSWRPDCSLFWTALNPSQVVKNPGQFASNPSKVACNPGQVASSPGQVASNLSCMIVWHLGSLLPDIMHGQSWCVGTSESVAALFVDRGDGRPWSGVPAAYSSGL